MIPGVPPTPRAAGVEKGPAATIVEEVIVVRDNFRSGRRSHDCCANTGQFTSDSAKKLASRNIRFIPGFSFRPFAQRREELYTARGPVAANGTQEAQGKIC